MTEHKYLEQLDHALSTIPKKQNAIHPYPAINIQYDSKYTILSNLTIIAQFLCRSASHILRYIASATGSRPHLQKMALYNNITLDRIANALENYYYHFVQCPHCQHHQTKELSMHPNMRCLACGYQWNIKEQ